MRSSNTTKLSECAEKLFTTYTKINLHQDKLQRLRRERSKILLTLRNYLEAEFDELIEKWNHLRSFRLCMPFTLEIQLDGKLHLCFYNLLTSDDESLPLRTLTSSDAIEIDKLRCSINTQLKENEVDIVIALIEIPRAYWLEPNTYNK